MGYGETAIVHHKQDFNITELSLSHASNCLLLGRVEPTNRDRLRE